ncbi:hypothetical protein DFJ74DRAFT_759371 [Hyaloraphidium curvatum]|nr:hypothetical protein DFJ74DRAFT_759371 [Hyaloraphidium curvatum]
MRPRPAGILGTLALAELTITDIGAYLFLARGYQTFEQSTYPSTVTAGNTLTIGDIMVENVGTQTVGSIELDWYLSRDLQMGNSDYFLGTTVISGLTRFQYFTPFTVNVRVPATVPAGNYYLVIAHVDGPVVPFQPVGTFPADNNFAWTQRKITVFAAPPGNPCLTNNGGCHSAATCTNNNGVASCTCPSGWSGNGFSCTPPPPNPCLTNNGGCHSSGTCINNNGVASCTCPSGWSGNGFSCTPPPSNPCATNNGGCDASATCINNNGVAGCTCPAGWEGNGLWCSPPSEDPCADNNGGCHAQATCTDNDGEAWCTCKSGWTGDGWSCQRVKANVRIRVTAASVRRGSRVTLRATVTRADNGRAVSGLQVVFRIGRTDVGRGTTNWQGVATFSYASPRNLGKGRQTITVRYGGSTTFNSASATGTLTVS